MRRKYFFSFLSLFEYFGRNVVILRKEMYKTSKMCILRKITNGNVSKREYGAYVTSIEAYLTENKRKCKGRK